MTLPEVILSTLPPKRWLTIVRLREHLFGPQFTQSQDSALNRAIRNMVKRGVLEKAPTGYGNTQAIMAPNGTGDNDAFPGYEGPQERFGGTGTWAEARQYNTRRKPDPIQNRRPYVAEGPEIELPATQDGVGGALADQAMHFGEAVMHQKGDPNNPAYQGGGEYRIRVRQAPVWAITRLMTAEEFWTSWPDREPPEGVLPECPIANGTTDERT